MFLVGILERANIYEVFQFGFGKEDITNEGDVTIIIHRYENEEAPHELHFTHARRDYGDGIESIYSMRLENDDGAQVNFEMSSVDK